jgi:hypothetical protein
MPVPAPSSATQDGQNAQRCGAYDLPNGIVVRHSSIPASGSHAAAAPDASSAMCRLFA